MNAIDTKKAIAKKQIKDTILNSMLESLQDAVNAVSDETRDYISCCGLWLTKSCDNDKLKIDLIEEVCGELVEKLLK